MHLAILLLAASLATTQLDPMRAQQWLTLDVFHVSRTLPDASNLVTTPVNPGLQLGYHRNVFGSDTFGAGFSFQSAYVGFDQLLW